MSRNDKASVRAAAPPIREAAGDNGPQSWAFALFVGFGAAQAIAGIVYFFAFNWRALPDEAKLAIPQGVMLLGLALWAFSPKHSRAGLFAGLLANVMIGVSLGVVGQVYQLGADPWRLFAIWSGLSFLLALSARSDAHFAIALTVGSIAYFLYADENLFEVLPQPASLVAAFYALSMLGVLMVREIMQSTPGWLRWTMLAAALGAALIGAIGDLFDASAPFENSQAASLALGAVGLAAIAVYRLYRPDRPASALALFALAAWLGGLGVRFIFMGKSGGDSNFTINLFLSAGWIAALTAMFAVLLRRLLRGAELNERQRS